MDMVLKVVFPVLTAVCLVAYLMRRKARLKSED